MLTLHVGSLILKIRVRVKIWVKVRVRVSNQLIYQVLTFLHVGRFILIAVVIFIYFKMFLFSRQDLIS